MTLKQAAQNAIAVWRTQEHIHELLDAYTALLRHDGFSTEGLLDLATDLADDATLNELARAVGTLPLAIVALASHMWAKGAD